MTARLIRLLFGLSIFLVLLGISACTPSPTPTETPIPEVVSTEPVVPPAQVETDIPTIPPTPTLAYDHLLDCHEGDSANAYFVCDQVILIGPNQDINEALDQLVDQDIFLEEISQRLNLGFLNDDYQLPDNRIESITSISQQESPEAADSVFPYHDLDTGQLNGSGRNDLAMGLFEFPGSEVDIIQVLDSIRGLNSEGIPVYADPNYLTGHLTKSPCANPFAVEGSPFAVEGSPFAVEGSPNGGMGLPASPDDFWTQWAFAMIGVVPYDERPDGLSGNEVDVIVLDTSPYSEAMVIDWADPPFVLNVNLGANLPLIPLSPELNSGPVGVQDHGLFVSGLVHGIAPESRIHLYPVLDANGCGDLFTLVRAIFLSILEMKEMEGSSERQIGSLDRVVYNLSLGVKKPRRIPNGPQMSDRLAGLSENNLFLSDFEILEELLRSFQDVEWSVESLGTAVFEAYRRGAVIVAAAGNDSVSGALRLPPELPAAYDFVIGVEAINQDMALSCFSNLGDVAAPGGDATIVPNLNAKPAFYACAPRANTCTMEGIGQLVSCPWGLISLTTDPTTGYAYWEGTSFSTPLVSGLAAVRFGSGATDPEQVRNQIDLSTTPAVDQDGHPIVSFPGEIP